MYSYWPPHMDELKQDGQQEHTFSSYVRIRDVVQKTCQRWWTIGKSGERGSGISVLPARHDDDDDIYYICIFIYVVNITYIYIHVVYYNLHTHTHTYIYIYIYVYIYIISRDELGMIQIKNILKDSYKSPGVLNVRLLISKFMNII